MVYSKNKNLYCHGFIIKDIFVRAGKHKTVHGVHTHKICQLVLSGYVVHQPTYDACETPPMSLNAIPEKSNLKDLCDNFSNMLN